MADRPEMFGPTRGFGDGRFNETMQNVVGPTLVAMATKFRLGAESNRLPACNIYYFVLQYTSYAIQYIQTQLNSSVQ